jgi:hypothetical protein
MPTNDQIFQIAVLDVLDDYQNVALSMANWSMLDGQATVTVFNDHLLDADAIIARLQDFDVVCVMREHMPMTRAVISRLPKLSKLALWATSGASPTKARNSSATSPNNGLSAKNEDVSYYPWTLSPYKSSFSCRGSLESGGRERRPLGSRRTSSRSRSCERIIHGAPLQSCSAGKVPSRSMRHIVEEQTDKAAAASLIVTSPRSARSPSR